MNGTVTDMEEISRSALKEVERKQEKIAGLYDALSRCNKEVPETLQQQTKKEIEEIHHACENFKAAYKACSVMEDELSTRLKDTRREIRRKWYLLNPPANHTIDLKEREAHHFARGLNGYKLGLIFFLGSFLGVVIELIWCLFTNGYLESRSGLVYGPFNLLYGVGAVVLTAALYRFRNRGKWLSFLGGTVVGSVVEYGCSLVQEMLFGSRSWDYSHLPFNLNGRICLMYSVFWGILGVVWMKDIYPRMAKWILRLPDHLGRILTWVMVIFLVFNGAVSALAVHRWSERVAGEAPSSAWEEFMDDRFPDERMESVYANMEFDAQEGE